MKEICQNQLLIDGVPAHQFGEWPGLKSSKWTGSIKILRPEDQLNMFSGKNKFLTILKRSKCSLTLIQPQALLRKTLPRNAVPTR